jgi:predicted acyltransferase
LVNNPGSDQVYAPLEHAPWNGWTFTDTVFPFFLWMVGVAMTLSTAKRVERGESRRDLFLHTLRRAVIIFGIGLFLNAFPYFHLSTLRIPGVLQRIAVCYLIAAAIFLLVGVRGIIISIVLLLSSYWLLMMFAPVPGYGAGHLDQDVNFAKYVDSLVLTGHMWRHTKTWDPEGLVSTLPAIATALFGVLMGYLLRTNRAPAEKAAWMAVMGNSLLGLGIVMDHFLPINKNLWTSSYAVFMAGLAAVVFMTCYWVVDVQGWRRWLRPFSIYGMNAIAVFIATGIVGRLLGVIKIGDKSMGSWIFENMFAPIASPLNASLLYAVANVLFFYAIVYLMYKRGWFLRF